MVVKDGCESHGTCAIKHHLKTKSPRLKRPQGPITHPWSWYIYHLYYHNNQLESMYGKYTWIFQICKNSAFWYVFWVKRQKFYTLGRSRYARAMDGNRRAFFSNPSLNLPKL